VRRIGGCWIRSKLYLVEIVMPGLDPGIHQKMNAARNILIDGSRVKPGDDEI
jgi:hypothetical protein